jgi:biopolymer transport protein ExbB
MNSLILFAQGDAVAQQSLLFLYLTACKPFFATVFILVSIVFVTLVIMNWLAISQNAIVPPEMIEQFHAKLDAKEYQEAYEIAKNSDSLLGRLLAIGLVKMSDNFAAAKQTMTDAAEEELLRLEHRLSYIGTIAAVSPMIGLLGTVYGMIDAFSVIAKTGVPQASSLSEAISLALVTTQVGLMIAIPALLIFDVFKNRLARFVLALNVQLEIALSRLGKDSRQQTAEGGRGK